MLAHRGEPLFHADWLSAVFLHFELDPAALQRAVPFALDLRDGRAFVSLVAFSLRRMRPRGTGRLGQLVLSPVGTSEFLNVRAYVRHRGEPGIFFLAEWLNNSLAVRLGPRTFGLPYRFGRIGYQHELGQGPLHGEVRDPVGGALVYECAVAETDVAAPFAPAAPGSTDEFLLERYTAFTYRRGLRRLFRVWHPPWQHTAVKAKVHDRSLLVHNWPMFAKAELAGANFSPGFRDIWMGRPHRLVMQVERQFSDGAARTFD
jgi:uncharacterized protein YqjF (DUF2071 family)